MKRIIFATLIIIFPFVLVGQNVGSKNALSPDSIKMAVQADTLTSVESSDSLLQRLHNTLPTDTIINNIDSIAANIGNMVNNIDSILPQPPVRNDIVPDSLDAIRHKTDSIMLNSPTEIIIPEIEPFKPDPKKAVIYSAIFPGLGQIYNRKYWKLPILYGGFIGLTYAISWNNGHYRDYSGGYIDIVSDDPAANRWEKFIPYGQTPETVDKSWLTKVLKDRKDYFRYYRDFSIIGAVAVYGLAIVDAYVDAQLFDFDVSPDLSMRIEPTIMKGNRTGLQSNVYGVRWSFDF